MRHLISIYIYIYQSEGFPRTGYFIPAHVGTGAGQIWEILPPAPSGKFFGKKGGFKTVRFLKVNVFFTIGHQKRDLSAPLPGNCSELRCASFSEKCKLQKKVSVSGDNLTPYF